MSDYHDQRYVGQTDPGRNPYLQGGPCGAQGGMFNDARSALFGGSETDRFIKGLLIGAAVTFLLTNEKAQQTIIKTGVNLFTQVASGLEEFKEKVGDARAEADEQKAEKEA